ncbi:hypothetical protein HanXRQr2_Chr13g0617581 [Helianthus annuus]|uniref:Uncharacterized protein n=1 Tax=Helianthus annuus TaxID=4232 RepID=A0A9K3HE69_HELAN|nr:hypothetical protein HanXRQr2_Chr13g0617581 [Helianthus annuus]
MLLRPHLVWTWLRSVRAMLASRLVITAALGTSMYCPQAVILIRHPGSVMWIPRVV